MVFIVDFVYMCTYKDYLLHSNGNIYWNGCMSDNSTGINRIECFDPEISTAMNKERIVHVQCIYVYS